MISLLLGLVAAYGVHLLWTSIAMSWTGFGPGPVRDRSAPGGRSVRTWLAQAGLEDVTPAEFVAVTLVLAGLSSVAAYVVFASPVPALVGATTGACLPVGIYRARRRTRRDLAQEAWPRIIEEIRILTGAVGRSIPQALFEAGQRAPDELRRAFEASHREWLLSTDFARATSVLKDWLSDPTADAACETLLVAHEVGGADLDARLEALVDDRIQDLQGRRDARARQAGVRFARRFVLVVPFGMALAGMSMGTGRAAYRTPQGQLIVVVGMVLVLACWLWAGRIMVVPEEQRVFES